jgi:hypothetical protein
VLQVRQEGRNFALQFVCRIGHTYATSELLEAKEELIEDTAWSVLTAFAELIALLGDLDAHAAHHGHEEMRAAYRERSASAESLMAQLRGLLESNRRLSRRHASGSIEGDPGSVAGPVDPEVGVS